MTLRITLLVLVTGLFALIWTHDRPAQDRLRNHPREVAQTVKPSEELNVMVQTELRPESWDVISDRLNRSAFQIQSVENPILEMPLDEAWMYSDCQMLLPDGIVPGEYRAVSNTGLVREFTLTLADLETYLGMKSDFVTRDIYQSETESLRWYFIRVQSDSGEVLPIIAERGGHIVIPAIAERSQTKQLEQQASRIIVNAGQRLATGLFGIMKNDGPARISTEIQDRIRL